MHAQDAFEQLWLETPSRKSGTEEPTVNREQAVYAEMKETREKLLNEIKEIQSHMHQMSSIPRPVKVGQKQELVEPMFDLKKLKEQITNRKPLATIKQVKPTGKPARVPLPNAPKPSPEEKPQPVLKQDFKPVMQICESDEPLREKASNEEEMPRP